MKAEEIRKQPICDINSPPNTDPGMNWFLREIAAQLAELNVNIAGGDGLTEQVNWLTRLVKAGDAHD